MTRFSLELLVLNGRTDDAAAACYVLRSKITIISNKPSISTFLANRKVQSSAETVAQEQRRTIMVTDVLVVAILLLLMGTILFTSGSTITHPAPLLPLSPETLFRTSYIDGWKLSSSTNLPTKQIPRHIWVGMKVKPNSTLALPDHLQKLFNRSMHEGWQVNVAGNKEKLEFMETYWPGTSVLWAFKSIHPALGNAACDIWRYVP